MINKSSRASSGKVASQSLATLFYKSCMCVCPLAHLHALTHLNLLLKQRTCEALQESLQTSVSKSCSKPVGRCSSFLICLLAESPMMPWVAWWTTSPAIRRAWGTYWDKCLIIKEMERRVKGSVRLMPHRLRGWASYSHSQNTALSDRWDRLISFAVSMYSSISRSLSHSDHH